MQCTRLSFDLAIHSRSSLSIQFRISLRSSSLRSRPGLLDVSWFFAALFSVSVEMDSWQQIYPSHPTLPPPSSSSSSSPPSSMTGMSLPLPREGHSAVAVDSALVIFGGISYAWTPFNDLWIFDTGKSS